MVTTRRHSKTLESFDFPSLPPVTHRKRKRSNDATAAASAAQPPNQSSTKSRKKVKSTAKIDTPPMSAESAPAASTTKNAKLGKKEPSDKSKARKQRRAKARGVILLKGVDTNSSVPLQSMQVDLTNDDDDDSSEDEAPRRLHFAASQDAEDDDTDSRYSLGSKRKGQAKKPAVPKTLRTAELRFEEDGLEEVDKAKAVVVSASKQSPAYNNHINNVDSGKSNRVQARQVDEKDKSNTRQKIIPPTGVPSRTVMYTITEAIAALSLYKEGTMSIPAEIDPQSRQPYEPLQTGEYLSYPIKGTYHLGALGRYGIDGLPPTPFSLTVPLSEYSFIQTTHDIATAEPSRAGLGFSSTLPNRPNGPLVRRPNNYCFTFGKYRGRRMDSVPIEYLRSIYKSDDYHNDTKLQQAFVDLYPKGLYESDAESYTFEKGGFKGKRLDEVPKSYLWGLLRKKKEGGEVGGKKGRGRLERALEVWENRQLDLTND